MPDDFRYTDMGYTGGVGHGTLSRELYDWLIQQDAEFDQLWRRYYRPIFFESAADDAEPSLPSNAQFASGVFNNHATSLTTLHTAMANAESERTAYWRGPAANLFGDVFAALAGFVDTTQKHVTEYARSTVSIYHDQHYYQRQWNVHKENMETRWRNYRAYWYQALLDQARRLDSTVDKSTTAYTTNLQTYRNNVAYFVDGMMIIRNESERNFQTTLSTLDTQFGFLMAALLPFETEPDFSTVDFGGTGDDSGQRRLDSDTGDGVADALDRLGSDLSDLTSNSGPGGLGDGPIGSLDGGGGIGGAGGGAGLPELEGPTGGPSPIGDAAGLPDLGLGGPGLPGTDVGGDGGVPAGGLLPFAPGMGLSPAALRSGTLVRTPDGGTGLDLNGDGRADVGMDGRALPGGSAPEGSRLVTGPDGTVGYDISGNDVPDLALDFHPLSNGDLPAGSRLITAADGTQAIDINGDGIPDLRLDGRAIAGSAAPDGGRLATGPDGASGFDLDGDGIPDVDFDGEPMRPAQQSPDPSGIVPGESVPGDQVRRAEPAGSAQPGMLAGYPMMPPMMGGMGMGGAGGKENAERERQTWLQEDDRVWADERTPVAALGRPAIDDDDDDLADEWTAPPKRPRPGARTQRTPMPGGSQAGSTRRQ